MSARRRGDIARARPQRLERATAALAVRTSWRLLGLARLDQLTSERSERGPTAAERSGAAGVPGGHGGAEPHPSQILARAREPRFPRPGSGEFGRFPSRTEPAGPCVRWFTVGVTVRAGDARREAPAYRQTKEPSRRRVRFRRRSVGQSRSASPRVGGADPITKSVGGDPWIENGRDQTAFAYSTIT